MRRPRASTIFNVAVFILGVVLLALMIRSLGWQTIEDAIVHTGWWFAVIAVIDLCSLLCDAFGLHSFLRARQPVGYWSVFAAQASGLAINRLMPANSFGEPIKMTMLARRVPTTLAVSAVVSFNLTTIYVGIAAIAIGVPVTAILLDLPDRVALLMWIGVGVLAVFAIAVAVIVRRGAVSTLIDGLANLGAISSERAARWRVKIADIDIKLRELGNAKASGLRRGLVGVIGSRLFNWTGTIAVLYAARIPLTPSLVIASLTVGILITWMTNVIPLGLGIADGTNYALYGLLGATPAAGLAFTMVNRLRTVVLAMMGLCVMAIANVVYRRSRAEDQREAGAQPREGDQPPEPAQRPL